MALRKFARLHLDHIDPCVPPWNRWGRNNWLRLATLVLQSEWLHDELGQSQADEVVFSIAGHANLGRGDYDWELIPPFIGACVQLHVNRRAFHPDGSAEYMLWDLLRLWDHEEPECPYGPQLRDLLLKAMLQVLELPTREAQHAALHGLGHHRDERARPAIAAFITSTDDQELREYAHGAYEFKVP